MQRILQHHYVLAVHDVRASAAFYVDALGFEVVDEPPGWIFVRKDGCLIMLGECPDDMHPSELGCHSYFAYLRVDDADAYHAQVGVFGAGGEALRRGGQAVGDARVRHDDDGRASHHDRTSDRWRVAIGRRLG